MGFRIRILVVQAKKRTRIGRCFSGVSFPGEITRRHGQSQKLRHKLTYGREVVSRFESYANMRGKDLFGELVVVFAINTEKTTFSHEKKTYETK